MMTPRRGGRAFSAVLRCGRGDGPGRARVTKGQGRNYRMLMRDMPGEVLATTGR